jgi:hypothetical protein
VGGSDAGGSGGPDVGGAGDPNMGGGKRQVEHIGEFMGQSYIFTGVGK